MSFSRKKIILLSLFLFLSVALPIFAQSLEVNYPTTFGQTPTTLPKYVIYIFNFACGIGAFIAFLMIVIAGAKWMSSPVNPMLVQDAKDQIKKALIGLLLIISVYVVLTTINPELAMIKLPTISKVTNPSQTKTTQKETTPQPLEKKASPPQILVKGKTVYDLLTNTREVENNAIQPISDLADFPNKCSCIYCNTPLCGCGNCVCSGGTYKDLCPMPDIQNKIDEIKEVIIPGLKVSRDGIQKLQKDADYYFTHEENYFVAHCQEVLYGRLKYVCGMEIKDSSCLSEIISNCGGDKSCESKYKNDCAEDCTFGEYFYYNPNNLQDCHLIAYGSPRPQQMKKEELIQNSITQKEEYLFGETLGPQKEELFNEVLKRQKEELIKEVQDQANKTIGEINKQKDELIRRIPEESKERDRLTREIEQQASQLIKEVQDQANKTIGEINKQKDELIQEVKKQLEDKRNQITEEVKKQLEEELSVGPLLEEQQYQVILDSVENQKNQLIQNVLNDQKNQLEKQLEDQKNKLLNQAKEPLNIKGQLNQLIKEQNTQLIGDLEKQQNRCLIQLTDSLKEGKDQLIFAIERMEAAIKAINDIIDLIDRCDCGKKPCTSMCEYLTPHGCVSGSCSCPGYPCPQGEWSKVKSEAQKARDAMQEKVNNLEELKQKIEDCKQKEENEVLTCEDVAGLGKILKEECNSLDLFCVP